MKEKVEVDIYGIVEVLNRLQGVVDNFVSVVIFKEENYLV